MVLINTTEPIGAVINSMSTNITGLPFLTYLFIILILVALLIAFRLNFDLIALIVSPVVIILMTYDSSFYVIGGAILMIFAVVFATKFFIKT